MKPDTVTVAVTFDDGTLAVMSFVTRGRFSDDVARRHGFRRAAEGGDVWERDATPEEIAAEVARVAWPDGKRPARWRVIDPADLPPDRSNRDDWHDDGRRIRVGRPGESR